jgi:hypothetical protein
MNGNKENIKAVKNRLIFYLFFMLSSVFFFSCLSQKELADPPIITSATYQHALYNGRGQPIEAKAAKENAPLSVTYYASEADYDGDINGFTEAPAGIGLYYARIRRPEGMGYKQGRDIKVEYHIQKPLPPPER